jgi:hypothetical protein
VAGALRLLLATGRVAAIGVACTWYPGHDQAGPLRELADALSTVR